jgi:hypothetical protein
VKRSAPDVLDVPPRVVTVTSTVPALAAAGLTAISLELLTKVTEAAGTPLKATTEPFPGLFVKPVPLIVMVVPPPTGPAFELIPLTVGTGSYVNFGADALLDVPPGLVTVIGTLPVPAGLVAVMDVLVMELGDSVVDPNATVVPAVKPVPVIVTDVPPARGPAEGLTPVTVGTAS